jgi:hypothetical protein
MMTKIRVNEALKKRESVGYKRPPPHARFRKGQSGNPQGRPKRGPTLKTELKAELNDLIEFQDGHRLVLISKQRAVLKRLVKDAIGGNARATAALLTLCSALLANDDDDDPVSAPEDAEIARRFGSDD